MNNFSYTPAKARALELFSTHKKMHSPIFGEVRITPEGFQHIEWKQKNHKRGDREIGVRYICFLHLPNIITCSHLYQEYRESSMLIEIKRNGRKMRENKIVKFYGLVAIVNNNKHRVKIVIRKVDGWNHAEFVSVIPVWKSDGYSGDLFFSEDLSFLDLY